MDPFFAVWQVSNKDHEAPSSLLPGYGYQAISNRRSEDNDDVRSTQFQYRLWPCINHIIAAKNQRQPAVFYNPGSNSNHSILTGKSSSNQGGRC